MISRIMSVTHQLFIYILKKIAKTKKLTKIVVFALKTTKQHLLLYTEKIIGVETIFTRKLLVNFTNTLHEKLNFEVEKIK